MRRQLFEILSIATVRGLHEVRIVALNWLLRCAINQKKYAQAEGLIERAGTTIKEELVSNTQMARFLYYNGVIKLFHLKYSEASILLQKAMNKVSSGKQEEGKTSYAFWFRRECVVRIVLAMLLQGELPPHSLFKENRCGVKPYFELASVFNIFPFLFFFSFFFLFSFSL